jgi:hypothetical protein
MSATQMIDVNALVLNLPPVTVERPYATTPAEQKLANQFATLDTDELRKTYNLLNDAIREKTKPVVEALESANHHWDELLPHLDDMQSMLSQRGEARDKLRAANLPGWSEWFKLYKKDTGLGVTLRAVQKRLAKFRAKDIKKSGKPDSGSNLSKKKQKQLVEAPQCANEKVGAMDGGGDSTQALKTYKQVAMDCDQPGKLPKSIATGESSGSAAAPGLKLAKAVIEQGFGDRFPTALQVLESANVPVPSVPAQVQKQTDAKPSPPMPKGGDWKRMLMSYTELLGKHTDAVFAELDERTLTAAFSNFAQGIADFLCRDSERKLRVIVESTGHNEHLGKVFPTVTGI